MNKNVLLQIVNPSKFFLVILIALIPFSIFAKGEQDPEEEYQRRLSEEYERIVYELEAHEINTMEAREQLDQLRMEFDREHSPFDEFLIGNLQAVEGGRMSPDMAMEKFHEMIEGENQRRMHEEERRMEEEHRRMEEEKQIQYLMELEELYADLANSVAEGDSDLGAAERDLMELRESFEFEFDFNNFDDMLIQNLAAVERGEITAGVAIDRFLIQKNEIEERRRINNERREEEERMRQELETRLNDQREELNQQIRHEQERFQEMMDKQMMYEKELEMVFESIMQGIENGMMPEEAEQELMQLKEESKIESGPLDGLVNELIIEVYSGEITTEEARRTFYDVKNEIQEQRKMEFERFHEEFRVRFDQLEERLNRERMEFDEMMRARNEAWAEDQHNGPMPQKPVK